MEELKRRLEILLGTPADAPVDESETRRLAQESVVQARREQVSTAGGELFASAFKFLAELVPAGQPDRAGNGTANGAADAVAGRIRENLIACTRPDEKGRLQLTLTLPDAAAVETIANSLARLLSIAPAQGRSNGESR